MSDSMIEESAKGTGVEKDIADSIVSEFCLQLHKRLYEYRGLNGDYIGEELCNDISGQAFYHVLGFLDKFSERYNWEEGSATEYLLRLGSRGEWRPFEHQTTGWKSGQEQP
ncbi:hypothetical protein ACS8YF_18515 [Salinisphaera sp. SWV1]|uniref:hypothetical protein n=1 Tax=Salinisphaera sp. SWV1 TaxID=3454139 RepID=UPI003F84A82D